MNQSKDDPYNVAQAIHQAQEVTDNLKLGRHLIEAASAQFEAYHSPQSSQLRKSRALNRYLDLIASPYIYPEGHLLMPRLELCVEILEQSRQRPVLETIGLTLLKIDFELRWTSSYTDVFARVLDGAHAAHTIPMLALCRHHSPHYASEFSARIASSAYTPKKTRVGELIETVHIYPNSPELAEFVTIAHDAIFTNTSEEEKLGLLNRLIRECVDKNIYARPERWKMLVDPVISQNMRNPVVIDMLEELSIKLPPEHGKTYMLNYTIIMAQHRRAFPKRALSLIAQHGTTQFIPFLYPSTQVMRTGLRGAVPTSYAKRVSGIIDEIIAREGVDPNAGGLSLAEPGAGGGLTILEAHEGTLSMRAVSKFEQVSTSPDELLPPILSDVKSPEPVSPRTRTFAAVGLSLILTVMLVEFTVPGLLKLLWMKLAGY